MYKTGYIVSGSVDINFLDSLLQIRQECEKLIVGLFSDDLFCRMMNTKPQISFDKRKKLLETFTVVDTVVEITQENISKRTIYEKYHFDVCYIGTQYGSKYQEDLVWAKEHNVKLKLPLMNGRLSDFHLLNTVLDNAYREYNIVLFGTGKYFDLYMEKVGKKYSPLYAVDNNAEFHGKKKRGVRIESPEKLLTEDTSKLMVIICCKNYEPIVEQLGKYSQKIDYRLLCNSEQAHEQALVDEWAIMFAQEKAHLEKAHELLLKLLVDFDRVCRKYNLRYFLNCGSVIGAVRHQGFIPWDDDVDVIMYQEDFDKLVKYAKAEWNESNRMELVQYHQLGNGAMLDFMHRLMYTGEVFPTNTFDKVKGKVKEAIPNHACLDIYILNKASSNPKKQKCNVLILKMIYGFAMGHRSYIDYKIYDRCGWFTKFTICGTSTIGKILPVCFIRFLHEFFARRFDRTDTDLVYESNGYVSRVTFKNELFGNGKSVPFYESHIMIPEQYDQYLVEHGYPDYMNYPPVSDRRPTHAIKSPELMAWSF